MTARHNCAPRRTANIGNTDTTTRWRGFETTGTLSHSRLVGMPEDAATLGDSLAVSYKTQHTFTTRSSSRAPRCLPRGVGNGVHTKTCTWVSTAAESRCCKPGSIQDVLSQVSEYVVRPDHGTLFGTKKKKKELSDLKGHGGNLNACYQAKEAHLKNPPAV